MQIGYVKCHHRLKPSFCVRNAKESGNAAIIRIKTYIWFQFTLVTQGSFRIQGGQKRIETFAFCAIQNPD